jgi:hypothetical protein
MGAGAVRCEYPSEELRELTAPARTIRTHEPCLSKPT